MERSFPVNAEGRSEFEMHDKAGGVQLHSLLYFQTSASNIINFRYLLIVKNDIDSWSRCFRNNLLISVKKSNLSQRFTVSCSGVINDCSC